MQAVRGGRARRVAGQIHGLLRAALRTEQYRRQTVRRRDVFGCAPADAEAGRRLVAAGSQPPRYPAAGSAPPHTYSRENPLAI